MYKVFVDDKPLFLTDTPPKEITRERLYFSQYYGPSEIAVLLSDISKLTSIKEIVLFHADIEKLWNDFLAHFTLVEAAGGLVTNPQGEQLFIFRNGRWDIPKGKIEAGESPKESAIREVEEECGISGLSIHSEAYCTYHTYEENKQLVLKKTYWYQMTTSDATPLTPQTEEGIAQAVWLAPDQQEKVLANTFNSIKDVLKEF